jgi:succinate dehydrogenase/fumarate reductase flavoprotein subunit
MASLQSVREWHDETDVLICGFGLAGAAAAIEAHDADPAADVLIVEKMPKALAGGNSRVALQSLLIARDAEALKSYQRALSHSNPVPEEMLDAWSHRMVELEPYIQARAAEAGAQYARGDENGWSERVAVFEFPEHGAARAVAHNATILPVPSGVWLAFKACVEKRSRIRCRFRSPAVDLIQDPDTLEVFGAQVTIRGQRRALRARRGVVLAVGGHENSPDMLRNYLGLNEAYSAGTPASVGDGVRMLQKAGADMWHLRNRVQSGGIWPGIRFPGHDTVFVRQIFWRSFSWIDIGRDDRRFCNETAAWHLTHFKQRERGDWVDTPHHRVAPMHMLFDETTRIRNRLIASRVSWNTVVLQYPWSSDNQVEIDKGWITKADSIDALALAIGRDPSEVAATVQRYNQACELKQDGEHGRSPATLQPLSGPPYYALEVVPVIMSTSGGARRNIESEVLDPRGRPIPRLYEAGELGSMFSDLYQNGSYLTEAMISGRAAGGNAVRLRPWGLAG